MAKSKGYGEEQQFLDEDVFNVLLQKSGMTMEQIAKESGYSSSSSISALLKGRTKPSITKAKKMADLLGCRLDVLLISPDKVSEEKLENYTSRLNRTRNFNKQQKDQAKKVSPENMKDYKRMLEEFRELGNELTAILYGEEI
ncbi:helix-turn-helix domain-containing protein [Lactobacillus delbrueckii]|uniref:helix-turn-helix domain-containing protein n=1 Tax=Lactobacillus delbrueckii TaxID=1584 RepID=UPI001E41501E|nr:helix-turn-helix domain-containing protein [Lactobacillus delbrueckii]MCD5445406.1 helix-turn-helix domain-containing protein [Lactobacillus delbrueckii subsp. lactis]